MFMTVDTENTGKLTYEQFIKSWDSSTYDLKEDDVKIMVSLADEDENELIPWRQFIPIAIEIIRNIYSRNFAGDNRYQSKKVI